MFRTAQTPAQTLEELIRITSSLATVRDPERLLEILVTAARELTCAESGRVYLLDKTKRVLYPDVSQGRSAQRRPESLPPVPLFVGDRRNERHVCAHSAFSGRLVHVRDIYQYSGFDFGELYAWDRTTGKPTGSVIAVPLRNHEERTIGVLQLLNTRDPRSETPQPFPAEMEGIVVAFASQAAVVLNNAQLIEQNHNLIEILDATNKNLEEENRRLRDRIEHQFRFASIVGEAKSMRRVFALMGKVLDTDATVLLCGETGTGKELVARAIHHNGRRRNGEFVAQNCAALPEGLLESELFGYRKGAFSGADGDKKGLIEQAHGGTLFLDEIGDMPLGLQSKLLRVLQEGEVRPLGALESRRVSVRVIAATHCDLPGLIREGRFREDLYYRLCVFPIELPALRERKEDLPSLLQHFLTRCTEGYRKPMKGFSPAAMQYLLAYDYPGNIRELRNLVERAVLMGEPDGTILPQHLGPELIRHRGGAPAAGVDRNGAGDLRESVGRFEARLIASKLDSLGWNQTRTARELNISRRTLIEKMHKYRIRRADA